jgi:hypothetical protein
MEGGDEGDISMLTELDYVLEEKKEQSYDVQLKKDAFIDDDDDDDAKEVRLFRNSFRRSVIAGGRVQTERH